MAGDRAPSFSAVATDPLLCVEGLHQHYGGSHILRGIDLDLRAGEVTVLLGRNGVGKTTLLKTLMGVVPSSQGHIRLAGQELAGLPSHARVRAGFGYVPQGREIFGRLSVLDNLRMGLAPCPASTPLPPELYELFPVLEQMQHRRGGDLSGGQQQQLAIARALAAGPKVLLLDEPTEGIQPSVIKDIGRVIRHLAAKGTMAILLVEQFYEFAAELADQYLVMERGEIVLQGKGGRMEADGVRQRLAL
ncbi:MAG: urea ABC transporter ATP-binding subunit UrtE [Inhella sp.]|uniref:urea ABC transporter ATP-binding subunit UrtE n=1 Tax=Inhella sp. TaxID=1921806 RepID=UPI0022C2F8EA|nr:urea ABC transporter ATP-binding subunit UrtE [Inhella sp.]MCZ8235708.1 urea ABC transporter ATP-binding subunit UrtE [Inhella sp.]